MIAKLIVWSLHNRVLVLLATLALAIAGVYATLTTPVDAIPDLSDVQVIVKTSYSGQSPRVVEDQVTYPLTTTMMSVPGARAVRGYSFYGDSYVYVLFDDGTDLYWARSRVLEYLNQAASKLPAKVKPEIGPDATGVGWIYEYALVDRSNRLDLAQLRSLQDWFLKFELRSVPGVAEVATIGGMVRQYQVVVDPHRLRALGIPLTRVADAIRRANQETGGAVLELAEAEYMVRASGYLRSIRDIEQIPLMAGEDQAPVLLKDVARVQLGPQMRRGIAELNGEGETVGAIIVMRTGKNALQTIAAVKSKLESLKRGLPQGVEIVPVYDRSQLIERAVKNLGEKLVEEFIVVAAICALFLFHLRSSLVAIISLPVGVLMAVAVMRQQGINANIMSLGGIAIAIGAMLDAAIVLIENTHKHLEQWREENSAQPTGTDYFAIIKASSTQVGPALFFSLLIITVSFLPVFALEAQEGRLFAPLAYTKTYAMAAASALSVTLVPVLCYYLVRGRIRREIDNPLNRWLIAAYQPAIRGVLKHPRSSLVLALLLLVATLYPVAQLGGEFMPALDEGDLLYMPTAQPGLSAAKAAELLQQTDRMIAKIPEVQRVFGKAGRAETATDPAPMEMFETTLQLKPREQWRPGMTLGKLIDELDREIRVPGLANVWLPPIRSRIDMQATGIKSPVGIKVSGSDLATIEKVAEQVVQSLRTVRGTASAVAERLSSGRYIDVTIDRLAAARYGLNVSDIQDVIASAVGGENVTETVEGLERYPVNVRFPRELRDSLALVQALPIATEKGATIPLSAVAKVAINDGPSMLRSENARLSAWIYVDIRGRDLSGYVREAQRLIAAQVALPPGYSLTWSGQFEYLERAARRLSLVVPMTLAAILLLLYLAFRQLAQPLIIMTTLPFALIGGFWLTYALGYNLSVAVAVGFIALVGVAAEFGVVMLIYIEHAIVRAQREGRLISHADLVNAIIEGAVLRVRPKAMTVAVIVAGLLPIMLGSGTGSEVMQRIAAPMVGGMVTAPLLSLFVIPAIYLLWRRRRLARQ